MPVVDAPSDDGAALWSMQTRSVEETFELGRRIGAVLPSGQVVALVGPLGAGKTQLVKGIACGNGLSDARTVTSPTFVLVNEYTGRLHLYHLDLYRLHGAEALEALGFEEMFADGAAAVVEWADRATEAMPEDTLWIRIVVEGESLRRFDFFAAAVAGQAIVGALRQ